MSEVTKYNPQAGFFGVYEYLANPAMKLHIFIVKYYTLQVLIVQCYMTVIFIIYVINMILDIEGKH